MESHKTYQAINPVELAKISQELIVKIKLHTSTLLLVFLYSRF